MPGYSYFGNLSPYLSLACPGGIIEIQIIVVAYYCATILIGAYFVYRIPNELYMLLLLTHYTITLVDRELLKSIEGIIILVTLILSILVKL